MTDTICDTVVVTGLGVMTPIGLDVPTFWEGLKDGRCGFSEIPYFDAGQYRNVLAGVVTPPNGTETTGRAGGYALSACREAVDDAGLDELSSAGIVAASNFGASDGPEGAGGGFQQVLNDLQLGLGTQGPSFSVSLSCASGAAAVGCACEQITRGRAEVMIAVGYEEISELWYSGLSVLRAITSDTIRPFDVARSGTLFGEGSGAVVLESGERAAARGATVYGRISGWDMNNDAYHMSAPEPNGDGIARSMAAALAMAGRSAADVDYVNAHGTATVYNDKIETAAIKTALGGRAREIPVVSIKSMISHMMGAAGIVEVISTLLSIRDGVVPPTMGLENADPECDLDYVPSKARAVEVSCAVSNSSGIGGANCVIVMEGV